jgi:hypothetical protein
MMAGHFHSSPETSKKLGRPATPGEKLCVSLENPGLHPTVIILRTNFPRNTEKKAFNVFI